MDAAIWHNSIQRFRSGMISVEALVAHTRDATCFNTYCTYQLSSRERETVGSNSSEYDCRRVIGRLKNAVGVGLFSILV